MRHEAVPGTGGTWGRHHIPFIAGAAITALLLGAALLSLVWTPYDPTAIDILNRLQGPTPDHWLGTDHFGRDILSLILAGAGTSVAVGIVAVAVGMSIGVCLGLTAAAIGGWFDEILQRSGDFLFAFPAILSAIMITALLGPGAINAILAIGIFNIPVFARLTRGAATQVWQLDYVAAARAAGKNRFRISRDHVLPNIASILIVQATIQFALAVLAEAGLSYLGFGVQPPQSSWGKMLFEAQTFLFSYPMLAVWPGLAIALTVLGLNLLGDGLRDLSDPRLKRLSAEFGTAYRG